MSRLQYFFSMKSRNRADALRLELIELAGGKCERCGFDDVRALVVHHVNHDRTERQDSEMIMLFLGKKKYQVLCENCHAIVTKEYQHIIPKLRKTDKLRMIGKLKEFRRQRQNEKEQLLNTLNGILHEVRRLDDNLPILVRSFVRHYKRKP